MDFAKPPAKNKFG